MEQNLETMKQELNANSSNVENSENESSLVTIIMKNQPGIIAKITNFCGSKNLNIEKLIASNFKLDNLLQRMILLIKGNRQRVNIAVEEIRNIPEVTEVVNFQSNNYIERELVLIKTKEENSEDIMNLVNDFNGQTVLFKNGIVIFQFINNEEKTNELLAVIEKLNNEYIEVLKSGLIATSLDAVFNN